MNNFIKVNGDSALKLNINIPRILELLDAFTLIIGICKSAKYPEDLEDIYDILDKYIPDWKNKEWEVY